MSSKNKSQLRTENSNNFPNNNSQFITPEKLRDFNNDVIDSMVVNQDTGSYLVTSSFDTGSREQTFTRLDGTTYINTIPGGGGETGSLLVTASVVDADITFTKGDGTTFDILVNNVSSSISASHAEFAEDSNDLILNVKNTSGADIGKGLAVHATGVTGENVNIELADSSNSSNMPSIGITREAISNNASGTIIISGKIKECDTSGFTAGENVYVGESGALTANKPTGSNLIQNIAVVGKVNASEGELIVMGSGRSNDLPNITDGYGWFGNTNGVPTAQTTASFAKTDIDNTFSGTQNFENISVSGTGSFGRIEAVTGSAKIIGDAFVVVNADTPTLRYAGLQVYDSGSSNATASIQWDGLNDSWILVEEGGESSFILTGPTGSLGSEANLSNNSIPKAGVHRQLLDSNITDNGTTITLGSTTNVSGPLSASNLESVEITNLQNSGSEDRTRIDGLSAETGSYLNTSSTAQTKTANINQTIDAPGTDAQKNFITVNGTETNGVNYSNVSFAIQNYPSFGSAYQDTFLYEMYDSFSYAYGTEQALNGGEWHALTTATGSGNRGLMRVKDNYAGGTDLDIQGNDIKIGTFGGTYANSTLQIGRNSTSNTEFLGSQTFSGGGSDTSTFNHNLILSASVLTDVETLTISSETSSIDFNTAQTKVLTLVSGSDTHLTFTNQGAGQTVILKVIQPGTGPGTLTLESSTAKQPTGLHYSASQAADAIDILTLQTMENDGTVFVVSAKQFD